MGLIHKMGDGVNTDEIIPGRYNLTTDPAELGRHVFAEVRPGLAASVAQGDVLLAGENFGCGSSREHAPIAILGAGFSCVIAASYARIFFRNAINVGLAILVCPAAVEALEEGDEVTVDLEAGSVIGPGGSTFRAEPLPSFLTRIIAEGGLVPYLRHHELAEIEQ